MNALQLKNGKFWLVPKVPKKGDYIDFKNIDTEGRKRYDESLNQALSNSIEVAEESEGLATQLTAINHPARKGQGNILINGTTIYPIEGLKYKVESRPVQFINAGDGHSNFEPEFKQVAIINK